jgi:hypothetical protein
MDTTPQKAQLHGIQESVKEDSEVQEILDIERRSRSTLGLR